MTKLIINLSTDTLKRAILTGILVAFVIVSMPVRTVVAQAYIPSTQTNEQAQNDTSVKFTVPGMASETDLQAAPDGTGYTVVRTYASIPASAYTSRVEECDSTPFITADGTHVADGIVAANFLKLGTKIRIPSLYGNKVFTVHDRMNARYNYRVDIWMADLDVARKHGVRNVTIEVVEPVQS